jgi:hypothetical protein
MGAALIHRLAEGEKLGIAGMETAPVRSNGPAPQPARLRPSTTGRACHPCGSRMPESKVIVILVNAPVVTVTDTVLDCGAGTLSLRSATTR